MFDSCGSASGAKQLAFIYDEVACQLHLRLEKVEILCETGSCLTEDFWVCQKIFQAHSGVCLLRSETMRCADCGNDFSDRLQHVFNKNSISTCRILDKNVGHRTDYFSILQDGTA